MGKALIMKFRDLKFRDPWIDPRIKELLPANLEAYLVRHGWKRLKLDKERGYRFYVDPEDKKDGPVLSLPPEVNDPSDLDHMINQVSTLALYEKRYAADVLTDLLASADAVPKNGAKRRTKRATAVGRK